MPIRALFALAMVVVLQGCTERALELLGAAAPSMTGDLGYPVPTCADVTASTLAGNGNNG